MQKANGSLKGRIAATSLSQGVVATLLLNNNKQRRQLHILCRQKNKIKTHIFVFHIPGQFLKPKGVLPRSC